MENVGNMLYMYSDCGVYMVYREGKDMAVKTREFGKALVECKGDKYAAYERVYGDSEYKTQHICNLMKNKVVVKTMRESLSNRGIDEDYLTKKFKELLDSGKEETQVRMLEMGLKLLGHDVRGSGQGDVNLTQVNYRVDDDRLSKAISKMQKMTERMNAAEQSVEDITDVE